MRAQLSLPPVLLDRKEDELSGAPLPVKLRIITVTEALNSYKHEKTGGAILPLAIVVACMVEQLPYKIEPSAASGKSTEHKLRRKKCSANLRSGNAV
ncbi:hypothetical protein KCU81_g7197, partial [Aureobasidium melanogenum]|uniref:Uncharacterized protein n=1 Tax=Aureobasidium melanogenum (strain CBS 110374) TaxID=1043003 RepID=A0A074VLX1_AURM1